MLIEIIVGQVVHDYIKANNLSSCFPPSGIPLKKWYRWLGFLKRWPDLGEKQPQHFSIKRATAATPDKFFVNLEEFLRYKEMLTLPHGDMAARMWNCDETGMSTAVASKTVLVRKGSRNVHQTASGSGRENITVICCGSAAGE